MLAWCRDRRLQRLLAWLLVATFVPLAASAHACQTLRHLSAAQLWPATMATADTVAQAGDPGAALAGPQPVDVLSHPALCHLLATAALPARACAFEAAGEPDGWRPADRCAFLSCRWPPPEHRPRLG